MNSDVNSVLKGWMKGLFMLLSDLKEESTKMVFILGPSPYEEQELVQESRQHPPSYVTNATALDTLSSSRHRYNMHRPDASGKLLDSRIYCSVWTFLYMKFSFAPSCTRIYTCLSGLWRYIYVFS